MSGSEANEPIGGGMGERPAEAPSATPSSAGTSSLLGSSAVMAVGTMASRITGVGRDIAAAAALGFYLVADAFSLVPSSTSVTIGNGAAGLPAQTANDYREVGISGRMGRANYSYALAYSP